MKRFIPFLLLLSLLLVSANQVRLVSFDVINKSGGKIAISMNGKSVEKFYYLRIPAGTREEPAETHFTVVSDVYTMQMYYFEPEVIVRYLRCKQPKPVNLSFAHDVRLVVLECIHEPIYTGEPYMYKFPIERTPY